MNSRINLNRTGNRKQKTQFAQRLQKLRLTPREQRFATRDECELDCYRPQCRLRIYSSLWREQDWLRSHSLLIGQAVEMMKTRTVQRAVGRLEMSVHSLAHYRWHGPHSKWMRGLYLGNLPEELGTTPSKEGNSLKSSEQEVLSSCLLPWDWSPAQWPPDRRNGSQVR